MPWGDATLHPWGPWLALRRLCHSLTAFPGGWQRGKQHQSLAAGARETPRVTEVLGRVRRCGNISPEQLVPCPAPLSASLCQNLPVAVETHPALRSRRQGLQHPVRGLCPPRNPPGQGRNRNGGSPARGEAWLGSRSCCGRAREGAGIPQGCHHGCRWLWDMFWTVVGLHSR